jgi:hypothetical protein
MTDDFDGQVARTRGRPSKDWTDRPGAWYICVGGGCSGRNVEFAPGFSRENVGIAPGFSRENVGIAPGFLELQ